MPRTKKSRIKIPSDLRSEYEVRMEIYATIVKAVTSVQNAFKAVPDTDDADARAMPLAEVSAVAATGCKSLHALVRRLDDWGDHPDIPIMCHADGLLAAIVATALFATGYDFVRTGSRSNVGNLWSYTAALELAVKELERWTFATLKEGMED